MVYRVIRCIARICKGPHKSYIVRSHESSNRAILEYIEVLPGSVAALGKDVSLMWRRERSLHLDEYRDIKKLLILLSKSQFYG